MRRSLFQRILLILLLLLIASFPYLLFKMPNVYAQHTWPSSWIEIDWDRNENGPHDDWRDVEYAGYQYDSDYLYLRLQCYDLPGKEWSGNKKARYKWFVDLDGNMYHSGENIFNSEYLLFVEDTDDDGFGEMYLVYDTNGDGNLGEYEPWPPPDYANYEVTDPTVGGWRIVPPDQIEMYIGWASIGNPSSYWLSWATDQNNPNLDQGPTTDHVDEEEPIAVHNVAALTQTPNPTIVKQGELVTIQVVVENEGTQTETFFVTCYFNNSVIGTELVTNLAAGQQTTLIFNWDTTGLPVANYNITSWADSSAAITETDEDDNWCTSPAIVTVQSAPVHDVAATSQVPDQTSVLQGAIVNIDVTVSNLGDFVETFDVACFYDTTPMGYQTVTCLPGKTSTHKIFAWDTTGVTPDTYYIKAMADSGHVITEVDEDNNNCTSFQTITVYSPGQAGNLFVDKVKTAIISGEDPPVAGLPTVYELTIIVTNIGGSDVSNIKVNETISSEVAFVNVGSPSQGSVTALPPPKIVWDVGTLGPGATATLTFRVSLTPASHGLIYVNHKEDVVASGTDTLSGNAVLDTGDTDVTVTAIWRDVAAISQVPTSTIVSQGDTIAIEVTVKNFGNVSETFDVTCHYDTDQIGVLRVYNLEAGSQTTISFEWGTTGISPGTYSITAEADSSNEITESDETNNICASPSAVQIVIHDIAIVSQAPSPTITVQGDTVTIEVVLTNEGTEPETFTVSCYYNNTLLETKTVTDLTPSATITLNFIWDTTSVPAGIYFINTVASTVPGERDTDDNACLSTTSVLVKLPLSVSIDPTTAEIVTGESVAFTSSVSGGEPPYSYQWYVNGSTIPGATSPSWTFEPSATGFYVVHLNVTDTLGTTAKSNEASVTVRPPLTISITPTSASILVGQSVEFTAIVSGGYPPYSYQWYLDDVPVPGATSSSWTFTPTSEGIYYVYVIVTGSTVQSATARVVVTAPTRPSVGGYSVSLNKPASETSFVCYTMLLAIVSVAISLVRRKGK